MVKMGKALSITAFVFSFLFAPVGFILGIIAVVKAKDDPQALKGLAIAAIAIGVVLTMVTVLGFIMSFVAAAQSL